MRAKDIELNKHCRLRGTNEYGWVKPICIIPPRTGINDKNYIVVKCEHTISKKGLIEFIRYFRPVNIINC